MIGCFLPEELHLISCTQTFDFFLKTQTFYNTVAHIWHWRFSWDTFFVHLTFESKRKLTIRSLTVMFFWIEVLRSKPERVHHHLHITNCFLSVFISIVTMSVLAQVRLRSTYLQMTRLLTPCWTPVREGQSRRSSLTTPVWILLHTVERPQPALPGSPPPTAHWDYRSRSINTSLPSPSRWKRHRLMSQCWPSRGSPSLSCHVTFINTNLRGGMMATPGNQGQTRSCRTINLFLSPAPPVAPSWVKQTLVMWGTKWLLGAAVTPNSGH